MSPYFIDVEIHALLRRLAIVRNHVLSSVEGLTDEQMRRPMFPSQWSAAGLIHHLALDVEREWFQYIMAGNDVERSSTAWQPAGGQSAAAIIELYRSECAISDGIIQSHAPDTAPRRETQYADLREIILHVIGETATHAGHLDILRELIDGHQHLVLT